MATETDQTNSQKSTWATLWDGAKEIITAGTGVAKDLASIKKTEAETNALNRQKAAPNIPMIAGVVLAMVVLVGGIVWLVKRKK